jgi:hypothetical protein
VRRIATGFGFLEREAGLPIGESLIEYEPTDSYLRALTVGVLNTLKVAVIGIILATLLGTLVGIARLSGNWLLSKIAGLLCRDHPGPAAAAAAAVLVHHHAGPARAAAGAEPGGGRVPLEPRHEAALHRVDLGALVDGAGLRRRRDR